MKLKLAYGCTRIVLLTKKYAIKFPNFTYSWYHFLKGLLANVSENETWKYTKYRELEPYAHLASPFGKYESYSDLLCPVKWCSWGGWILVMEKADCLRHENEIRQMASDEKPLPMYVNWINNGYDGDIKPDNFGYYKNRLVKIDYA